jgi:Fe-S cluster biogenesis protein NfuA
MTGETTDDSVLAQRARELGDLMEVISAEVARDGGTAELGQVDYRAGRIEVILAGACGSCSLTGATLEDGIKRILTQRLDWVAEVAGTVREERGLVGRNGWRPLEPG